MKRTILIIVCNIFMHNIYAQQDTLSMQNDRLDSPYQELPEILIKGERPIVKAESGKLVYDLPRLIQDKGVTNIYDAIKELPGVMEINDALTLSGQGVSIVIDGKVSSMTTEQLYALLRSMPANRIAKAEVMYNASAKHQVRGAMINITLKKQIEDFLQSEIMGEYKYEEKGYATQRASFLFNNKRWTADVMYRHGSGTLGYSTTDKFAKHTLTDGTIHQISTHERKQSDAYSHSIRVGSDYHFSDNHQLSLVYNGVWEGGDGSNLTQGSLNATLDSKNDKQLHNVRFDYDTPIGLKVGIETTYYQSPFKQWLTSNFEGNETSLFSEESQRINRWRYYLTGEHTMASKWSLNYGATYSNSIDHSHQYFDSDDRKDMKSRLKEETLNLYMGVNRQIGEKILLDFSLATEHYKTILWNQWDWYPTLNLVYQPSTTHILQLSFSSDKEYPGYWAMQNATTYLNSYSEIQGNPFIKPSKIYNTSLTYILKGKYIFQAYFNHTHDYAIQTHYQLPERLVEVYKYVNLDFSQQAGLMVSIPFSIGNWLNSRWMVLGMWMRQKDSDFYNIPFDRKQSLLVANTNNTIKICSKPDLRLQVNGRIQTKAIQATYDLPTSTSLDVKLRYAFAKGKAIVTLYCNDIFESSQIDPYIHFANQWVENNYSCYRQWGASFTWQFGAYKEKKRTDVDSERFK